MPIIQWMRLIYECEVLYMFIAILIVDCSFFIYTNYSATLLVSCPAVPYVRACVWPCLSWDFLNH